MCHIVTKNNPQNSKALDGSSLEPLNTITCSILSCKRMHAIRVCDFLLQSLWHGRGENVEHSN